MLKLYFSGQKKHFFMILLRGLLSEFSYLVAEVHTSSTVSEISHFLQLVLRATLRSHQVTSHHLEIYI